MHDPIMTEEPRPIPVTLLTGFLGSGKTTVLNHLVQQPELEQPELADALVIINEFGEMALDHLLVAHSTESLVMERSSGCLCCTIRGDLVQTLRDISWRFSRNGERQFRRVLIETTGLADPAPILHYLDDASADRTALPARRHRRDHRSGDRNEHPGPARGSHQAGSRGGRPAADQGRPGHRRPTWPPTSSAPRLRIGSMASTPLRHAWPCAMECLPPGRCWISGCSPLRARCRTWSAGSRKKPMRSRRSAPLPLIGTALPVTAAIATRMGSASTAT